MAFAQDIRTLEAGLVQRISSAFKALGARYAEYRLQQRTFNELNALSDRELDDLGLNRSMLASIAFDAAKNN
jgi:uncharacterized protein YjiS (DUF1127 family)